MSHFSTLRTKITDAEVLKSSLRDLGLMFVAITANAFVPTLWLLLKVIMIWAGHAMLTVPLI